MRHLTHRSKALRQFVKMDAQSGAKIQLLAAICRVAHTSVAHPPSWIECRAGTPPAALDHERTFGSAIAMSATRASGQVHQGGNVTDCERQRLEICNKLRSPIQVLARSASALRAAGALPRALYSSASP
jgi:hypothetical protein